MPVFLPGRRSLAGDSLWSHTELDMTERLTLSLSSAFSTSVFQTPDYPETRVGWELPFLQYDFMCKLNIYQAPTKCQELCQSAENLVINKAGEVLVGTKHTNKTLRSFIVMGSGEMQH